MAKATLDIELDEPGRTYGPREVLRGSVHARVEKAMRCDALELSFTLVTSSEHHTSKNRKRKRTVQLFTGDWEPGEYSYPFEIAGPRWPPNYEGALNQWQWMLTATADIPMAIDVEQMLPIDVKLPPSDGVAVVHKNPGNTALVAGNQRAVRIGAAFVAVGMGLCGIGVGVSDDQLIGAGISVAVIAAFVALFKYLKTRDIGAPQLVVEQTHDGEQTEAGALKCALWIKPEARIADVTCNFVVYERLVVSSGGSSATRNRKTYENEIYGAPVALKLVEQGLYRGELALPAPDALPHTIQEGGTTIGWSIKTVLKHENGVEYPLPDGVLWSRAARGPAAD